MFKKLLQFKTFLIVCLLAMVGTSNVWGQTTKEFSFAFTTIGSTGWSSSYASHTYKYTEGTVYFTEANKQNSTITDVPVTKGKPVEFVMKEGFTISEVTFSCKQWVSKTQTITLHYSTDGGENYTSTGVTSTNFTIAKNDLPTGTNAVKITFSTSNQVGVSSVKLTYTSSTSASLNENDLTLNVTEKNFDLKDGANQTFQLTNSGNADGDLSYESSNEAVATVSSTGEITAVGEGTATITVTQAESSTYNGGTATCTVTVTDSRYKISNLTFTDKCNGSGTAGDGAEWTVASDGTESNFDAERGIHYGTNSANVQYIELSTSDINGTIKKIVVNASTASGVTATVGVNVGGSAFGGEAQTLTTSAKDYTFTGSAEGEIIVTVTKPSSEAKAIYVKSVKVYYEPSTDPSITVDNATVDVTAVGAEGTITVTYENIDVIVADVAFYEADGETPATYGWLTANINSDNNNVEYQIAANDSEARTAYMKVWAYDNDLNEVYSNLITVTQAAYVDPNAKYNWVLTDLKSLTSGDVFVIVGDNGDTYALSNNNGTSDAPKADKVTIVNNTLKNAPEDKLKWNISGNAEDGYTFYPNGSTVTWLYCTNTNNGVRVGTNDDNKTFTVKDDYLYNTATSRYLGVYNSQDWRCYSTIHTNIQNQKFAFYKRVPVKTVMIDDEHYATLYHGTNLEIPSGVVAKTVTVDDEGILTVEDISGGVIPALTGVLLYAAESNNTEYTFNGTDEECSVDIKDNNLTGVLTNQTVREDGYVFFKLADGADGLGFYYDQEGGTSINAKAGKAFLRVSNEQAQSIRGFVLSDAKTGVAEFTMQKKQREAYDLQGRRVSTPKNGLYIINGKKVFVK